MPQRAVSFASLNLGPACERRQQTRVARAVNAWGTSIVTSFYRTRGRAGVTFIIAVALVFSASRAVAEWSATLPAFAICRPASQPSMPYQWRAVGLMMPFEQGQLDVGDFVYDGLIPAMRASVYGLESGAVDLLITNEQTYRLSGPHAAPTGCTAIGRQYVPPPVQWLTPRAICIGEGRVWNHQTQWWKIPGKGGAATWHWFSTGRRLPLRSMFISRSSEPAVIGDYAMTYFAAFTPLQETNLNTLRAFCEAQAPVRAEQAAARTARSLAVPLDEEADEERVQRIGQLIPGLSYNQCSRMKRVRWPDQMVMTAFITPSSFSEEVNSSLIYYDWKTTRTQLALMFQGRPLSLKGLVSLKQGVGYRVLRNDAGGHCDAVFPGIVRPNWAETANCTCRGVIGRHETLSPYFAKQIFNCPIKWQGKRTMWNWYTTDGQPVMFAEAGAKVGGVVLADYHDWLPGQQAAPKDFELPRACFPGGNISHAPADRPVFSDPSCTDCHTSTIAGSPE